MDQGEHVKMDNPNAIAKNIMIDVNLGADSKSPPFSSAPLAMGEDSNMGIDEGSTRKGSAGSQDQTQKFDTKTGGRNKVSATGNVTNEEEPSFTPNELSLEAFISAGDQTQGWFSLYPHPLL